MRRPYAAILVWAFAFPFLFVAVDTPMFFEYGIGHIATINTVAQDGATRIGRLAGDSGLKYVMPENIVFKDIASSDA